MVANSYTFQESVDYLLSLGNEVSAMKLGLDSIHKLLIALGRPAVSIPKVQVAGTNGKGSVCAFLSSICRSAGIRTGLYTSPHLISITERIKIDGVDVSEPEFARIARFVRETSEWLVDRGDLEAVPTFFEQVTAIALVAFAGHDVELIILETGLGGRLDAATAADAEIAAITRIDYDHQQYLGETLSEIAAEKAAVIHKGSKVAVGEQYPDAMAVITSTSTRMGVSPRLAQDVSVTKGRVAAVRERADLSVPRGVPDAGFTSFKTERAAYPQVRLGLLGSHQIENARLAILAAEMLQENFNITRENIIEGLTKARHPGRLEFIGGDILLDGAHNLGGAKALRDFLDEFIKQPVVMIFGAMADKNIAPIAAILFPKAETLILTKAANSRAFLPEDLRKFVPPDFDPDRVILADSLELALDHAKKHAEDERLILVTGSLYLVGEAKAAAASSG